MMPEGPPSESSQNEASGKRASASYSRWKGVSNGILLKFLLLFASGWAVVQILDYFRIVVVIFVTATILAFLLSHPVAWLSRWVPRGVAVGGIFAVSILTVMTLTGTLGIAVLSQGDGLVASLGDFLSSLQPRLEQLEASLQSWNINIDIQGLEAQLRNQALGLLGTGISLLTGVLTNLVTGILIAVVTVFMLLDGGRIWWWLLKWLPSDRRTRFHAVVQRNLLGFFWGRLLLALFFGTSSTIIFLFLKVPFALVLGVMAGLFDLIPGIGATMGIGLICLLLLTQSVWLALKALIACVILQQVEENILLPHIMRDSLDINPVVMFFALLVGFRVAGVLGIFLAIPVAGVVVSWLEIEEMKGGKNSLSPTDREKSQQIGL